MIRAGLIALVSAVMVLCAPHPAHAMAKRPVDLATQEASVRQLQQLDQRLFATGWRMVAANAPFCDNAAGRTGMMVQDAAGFDDPALIRRTLSLSGDIAVEAVAPDSPAEAAGLQPGMTLLAIGDRNLAAIPPGKDGWERAAAITSLIEDAAAAGPVEVRFAAPGEAEPRSATIIPAPACASRFEVVTARKAYASSDGNRVMIGTKPLAAGIADDELAALVAHELAHNLLRHNARLREAGGPARQRPSEADADRLAVWLLANAGYDPAALVRLLTRIGPDFQVWFIGTPSHGKWQTRVAAVEREIAAMEAARGSATLADWRRDFVETLGAP